MLFLNKQKKERFKVPTGNFNWNLVKESPKGVLDEQNIYWKDRDKTEMELYKGEKTVLKKKKTKVVTLFKIQL